MATIRHNTAHAYLPFPVHDRSVPWHSHRLRAAARATTNPTQALAPDVARDTPLGRAITPLAAEHPGKSGIHALADAHDAFAARMMLARTAQRSLDVQYYIWHDDMTGTMLMEALHAAADRGVRVRLLLDDNGTSGLDTVLAAMDAHPNIEVRLYNPSRYAGPRPSVT